jgi:hypothetical protein
VSKRSFSPTKPQAQLALGTLCEYLAGSIMRWLKPNIRNSLYGLLGNRPAPSDSVLESGTEDIRELMLTVLGAEGARRFPQITRRIRYANDIQALWYLRGDLMAALASMQGEAEARKTIASVSAQFQGLLPGGLASRPSPLVG